MIVQRNARCNANNENHRQRRFMTKFAVILAIPALLALSACGGSEPDTSNSADDFAARINGGATAPASGAPAPADSLPPQVAQAQPNAAPGMFEPGSATDPATETCSANRMGPFMGRVADEATRAQIQQAAVNASAIRFLEPGSGLVADVTNPRLNLMLDNTGTIRDARCG